MPKIGFDELDEGVQETIAKLQVDVDEIKFEAYFNRAAVLIAFGLLIERLWDRFF